MVAMGNPKHLLLPPGKPSWGEWSDGIDICFTKRTGMIRINGWYDGCVGFEGGEMPLKEFFDALGITEQDCKKAFTEVQP